MAQFMFESIYFQSHINHITTKKVETARNNFFFFFFGMVTMSIAFTTYNLNHLMYHGKKIVFAFVENYH